MAEQSRCGHEGCNCDVPRDRAARGDRFCSDYCQKHATREGHAAHACGCGHAPCSA